MTEAPVTTTAARDRDRWLDLLQALALVRVMTSHAFAWLWLPLVYPSMGVLFAVGGRLVASSLDRASGPAPFYLRGIQRLLAPLWAFGLVAVPLMLAMRWTVDPERGSAPFTGSTAWTWIFPLVDPPGSDAGYTWVSPLWFLRTCLWLVLLSPGLLWLFRRWPRRVAAVPVVILALLVSGLLNLDDSASYDVLVELGIFTCCWLVGFAHHDGLLQRLDGRRVVAFGGALMGLGTWYALAERASFGSYDLDDIPLADMLYSLGAVLVLLRFRPPLGWLRRFPTLDAVLGLVTSRAVTIYVWSGFALWLAPILLTRCGLAADTTPDVGRQAIVYGVGWLLVAVAVLLFGWIEDVAAARRPRLLVWTRVPAARSTSTGPTRVVLGEDPASPAEIPTGTSEVRVGFEGNTVLAGPEGGSPDESPPGVFLPRPAGSTTAGRPEGVPGGRKPVRASGALQCPGEAPRGAVHDGRAPLVRQGFQVRAAGYSVPMSLSAPLEPSRPRREDGVAAADPGAGAAPPDEGFGPGGDEPDGATEQEGAMEAAPGHGTPFRTPDPGHIGPNARR